MRTESSDPAEGLPAPPLLPIEHPCGILVTGIGRAGVITIRPLLDMGSAS